MLLGILNSQVSAAGGSYELISSQILTGSASSVTFSSIPSDFKHLQVRYVANSNRSGVTEMKINLNGDTGSNYAWHFLYGDGSSVASTAQTSRTSGYFGYTGNNSTQALSFGPGVVDILDYSNTSKNTTLRALTGSTTGINNIGLYSNLWINTAAVTTIALAPFSANDWVIGSRFSLYGIRG